MDLIIPILTILLIIVARLAWFQTDRIVELHAENEIAQTEIRELKSKLCDANNKPTQVCEACAAYPCKCE